MKQPSPTKTFVLDVGRKCNVNCTFCYYAHLGDLKRQSYKKYGELVAEINEGIARGNDRVEITGGEPTGHPQIVEIVKTLSHKKIKSCVITNGMASKKLIGDLIDAGVNEFLFSVHGTKTAHDILVNCTGAFAVQKDIIEFVDRSEISDGYRFNFVLNRLNDHEILKTAHYFSTWHPTIVNFINMNPHHDWVADTKTTRVVIADLRIVQPALEAAIEHLEYNGINVNVRYYPMCYLKEEYRRCICNDLHVMFDPKEWDYKTTPKTVEKYKEWGRRTSAAVEEKKEPCNQCGLQWICGGVNKHWHKACIAEWGELMKPEPVPQCAENIHDFYCYRQHARTL